MAALPPAGLQLGLGLLSIGRVWGVAGAAVPDEREAMALLEMAVAEGIRIFDTAPAYAASEARFGRFLSGLPQEARGGLAVMTKMGEHWDAATDTPFVDHSRDALIRSIDRSLALLGRIDLLQLHKATGEVVASADVRAAIEHARRCGILSFGASVSSVAAGEAALATGLYQALQFPMNAGQPGMAPLLPKLAAAGGFPIFNRPFAMGGAVQGEDKAAAGRAAFRFLRERAPRGVVLTGTGKSAHLRENVRLFRESVSPPPAPATPPA